MDGTTEILLIATGQPGGTLIIRFKGKSLDVYAIPGEIVDGESAAVRVKFDDGAPTKESWTRSTDYKGLFSPRPFELLKKLKESNKFYLEYQPFQSVPKTVIFDVTGLSLALPQSEMAIQEKKSVDEMVATAALRARILLHVHGCAEQAGTPEQWCWSDPHSEDYSIDVSPFTTKEEAMNDAVSKAHLGLAFKK